MQNTDLNHFCQAFFTQFCNQLPDFSVSGTFAANGLKRSIINRYFAKLCQEKN